jgi:hypothetical protein
LFEAAVEAALSAKLEKLGLADARLEDADADAEPPTTAFANAFVKSVSKNEQSPPAGVGSTTYVQPSAKSKSKGRGKSKATKGNVDSGPSGPRRGRRGPRSEPR